MNTKHTHQFAVDAACDCGAMISDVVRKLATDNAALIAALEQFLDWWLYSSTIIDLGEIQAVLAKAKAMG